MKWEEILSSIGAVKSNWILLKADLREIAEKMREGGLLTASEIIKLKKAWQEKQPFADDIGNPFVLFIYDRADTWNFMSSFWEYKFHFMWCPKLESMEHEGRRARYKAKYDIRNPHFPSSSDKPEALRVCKYCLKNFSPMINQNVNEFNIQEFFDTYGMQNLKEPTHSHFIHRYTKDWPDIARRYKSSQNWRCEGEGCGRDFLKHKEFLHAHHKNGVKDDNRNANLAALCCECHGKQPGHSYMGKLPPGIKLAEGWEDKEQREGNAGETDSVVKLNMRWSVHIKETVILVK